MEEKTEEKPRYKRYAISVTGAAYDRLSAMPQAFASVSRFVDELIVSALDDPTTCERVLKKCRMAKPPA